MAVYVLGDPHLSFSTDKPMDVFGSRWANHSEKIREAWLKNVKAEDTVVLAGDLSWAMSLPEAEEDLAFFHHLPGKKILLKGNHDYWWDTVSKMNRFFAEREWDDFSILYNNCFSVDGLTLCGTRGWDVEAADEKSRKIMVRELQRLERSLAGAPADQEKIAFFHFPPLSGGKDPFLPILQKYHVCRCYFGHLHGPKAFEMKPFAQNGISYTLVSADALNFQPLLIPLKPLKTEGIQQNCQKRPSFWAKVLSLFGR